MKKKKVEGKFKIHKWLIINWKRFFSLVFVEVFSLYAHDFISILFGFNEPFFFAISVIIPIYILFSAVYTLIKQNKGRKK